MNTISSITPKDMFGFGVGLFVSLLWVFKRTLSESLHLVIEGMKGCCFGNGTFSLGYEAGIRTLQSPGSSDHATEHK